MCPSFDLTHAESEYDIAASLEPSVSPFWTHSSTLPSSGTSHATPYRPDGETVLRMMRKRHDASTVTVFAPSK